MAEIVDTYWLKDVSGKQSIDGVIEQTESCIIVFDQVVETTTNAISDSLFKQGQEHRTEVFLFLNGDIQADVHEDSNGTTWQFTLRYSSSGYNNSNSGDDSDYRPPVELGSWSYMQIVEHDKESGEAILNTAGEPYNPMPETQVSAPVIKVTVRENSANIQRVESIGSINNSQVKICGITFPKYCAMLDSYDVKPFRDEENFLVFFNTFTIKGKFFKNVEGDIIGFKQETISRGFNELRDGELAPINVKDVDNNDAKIPTSEPAKLDINGAFSESPYYQEWVIDDLFNFSTFGLPTNYPVY